MSFLVRKSCYIAAALAAFTWAGCQSRVQIGDPEAGGSDSRPNPGRYGPQLPLPTGGGPVSTPGSTPQSSSDVSTGKASFAQSGGYFHHPKEEGRAGLAGGQLEVDIRVNSVRVFLSGLSADSRRQDVRKAADGINGETLYARVPFDALPMEDRFRKATFLIFSNSVRNNKGVTYTTAPGEFFPAFALAGGKESDFAILNAPRAALQYPVTFIAPDGRSFRTTIVVGRVTTGNGPCGAFAGLNGLLGRLTEYYGVKIELSPPPGPDFVNGFPVGTTFYAVRYANGGIVSNLGSCSSYWDNKNNVSGYARIEFGR